MLTVLVRQETEHERLVDALGNDVSKVDGIAMCF